MKTTEIENLNEQALADPQPGDYWQEMFCPYFVVVQVNGSEITVLSCLGGPNSYDRKHEPNARIDNKDNTWSFDYSKSMAVDRAWIRNTVTYGTIDGFVADVVRSDKTRAIADEWVKYRATRLLAEFKALGPAATDYLLQKS